jgi:hypothetical protein
MVSASAGWTTISTSNNANPAIVNLGISCPSFLKPESVYRSRLEARNYTANSMPAEGVSPHRVHTMRRAKLGTSA